MQVALRLCRALTEQRSESVCLHDALRTHTYSSAMPERGRKLWLARANFPGKPCNVLSWKSRRV